MYSKKVIQHFQSPKNMGKLKNPDSIGEAGNSQCGDTMKIYLKISAGKIKEISFETMGCVSAIATSSMITELAKGKTLAAAALLFPPLGEELLLVLLNLAPYRRMIRRNLAFLYRFLNRFYLPW